MRGGRARGAPDACGARRTLLAAEGGAHGVYAPGETARLDGPTVRHLELLCRAGRDPPGSVLGELDSARTTPAGS